MTASPAPDHAPGERPRPLALDDLAGSLGHAFRTVAFSDGFDGNFGGKFWLCVSLLLAEDLKLTLAEEDA